MGCDAAAKLIYGILLNADHPQGDDSGVYAACTVYRRKHLPEPGSEDYKSPKWDAWRAALRDFEKSPLAITEEFCGYGDSLRPCIASQSLTLRTYGTAGLEINPDELQATPQHDAALKEFCEQAGFPWQQPR